MNRKQTLQWLKIKRFKRPMISYNNYIRQWINKSNRAFKNILFPQLKDN